MSFEDYYNMFEVTWMNHDPSGMDSHYFLRLDDDGSSATKLEKGWRHELTVSSEIDQTIYLVAHTWDMRAYSPKCLKSAIEAGSHLLEVEWDTKTAYTFFFGSMTAPSHKIHAGESAKVTLTLNFGPEESKDWSIVAYGTKGPVGVYHSGDLESATMPLLVDPNADLPEN